MKEYLKENIDFNKLLFSTTVTIATLISGGLFGLIFQNLLSSKVKFLLIFISLIILISLSIILSELFRIIKINIEKLKENG